MRTKPTISEGEPREAGPHGVTLTMRKIGRGRPAEFVHQHLAGEGMLGSPPVSMPYVNLDRDRSRSGKARRRARKAVS